MPRNPAKIEKITDQHVEFARLWHEGLPAAALAERFGVSHQTIRNWRAALGLPQRRSNVKRPSAKSLAERDELIARLFFQEGKSIGAIARELRLHPDRVETALERVETRRRNALRKKRNCLRCSNEFLSDGPHNRLCDACRSDACA